MKQIKPDTEEIKRLASAFAQVPLTFFPKTNGDREEIARQMLTTLSALSLASQIIKEHAESMGMTMHVACVTEDELLRHLPTAEGKH